VSATFLVLIARLVELRAEELPQQHVLVKAQQWIVIVLSTEFYTDDPLSLGRHVLQWEILYDKNIPNLCGYWKIRKSISSSSSRSRPSIT